jgi:3-deoxy-D-manno-octulosonic-acid transferase
MPYLLNLIYLTAAIVLAPWLCWQAWMRNKPVRGLRAKWFGRVAHSKQAPHRPIAWFHGVSVGEIHLLRQVVAQFRARFPDWQCIVSTTTGTGYDEACKHFSDLTVVFWPFDFTWAVAAALDALQPSLVVLSEGEVWPNFVTAAKQRGVKVAVLNGRMSPRSARRFRAFRWLLAGTFAKIDWIGAQNDEYRMLYDRLGATNVVTTGNIKYDGVLGDRRNAKTQALRTLFGISVDAPVLVAGSTQDPEESAALEVYRRARAAHPTLRLILVPRHPERFDDVARLLARSELPFIRRSAIAPGEAVAENNVILVDTIGELGAIWGLADLAFVGGSLDGKRGGQNMIEPSAYGAAVLFGPHTWNFKQTVADLLARNAAVLVENRAMLEAVVLRLLKDPAERIRLGDAAQAFVVSQQGASAKTLNELAQLMEIHRVRRRAA